MADSRFEVCFDGDVTLDAADKALGAANVAVERDGDRLIAHGEGDRRLDVVLASDQRRFEVRFDDRDSVDGDLAFEILTVLQQLTGGQLFLHRPGSV